MKRILITTIISLTLTLLYIKDIYAQTSNFNQEIMPITECNDGVDNDGDGGIDFATDDQCLSWLDDSELIDESIVPPDDSEEEQEEESSSIGENSFFIDSSEEEESTSSDSNLRKVSNTFLWKPLGKVLGISEDNLERNQIVNAENSLLLISCCFTLLIVMGIFYPFLKRRKKEDDEEDKLH